MNKVLFLLLLTFVQSQSDAILLSDNPGQTLEDSQSEEWEGSDFPFSGETIKDFGEKPTSYKKRSPNDVLTRRSALDKNFMRFGRGDAFEGLPLDGPRPRLLRVGRGLKDNFIRFGRGAHDGFIRFGRPDSKDFFRARKTPRDNFIRFGKVDKNFMRFGRDEIDTEDYPYNSDGFERTEKASKGVGNFIRFGKSGNSREGRNGTNFLRFGKKDSDMTELDSEDVDLERTKREVPEEEKKTEGDRNPEATQKSGHVKRSTGFFEQSPQDFRRYFPILVSGSWENFDNLKSSKNSRATPFFPEYSRSYLKPGMGFWVEPKRTGNPQGGSNFIRFG